MNERVFSVSFSEVAVTAQQDLFQIEALNVPAKLHAVYLSQSTDVGDAQSEGLSILIQRVTDAVTNDLAEAKIDAGSAAANADLAVNETTELTTGAEVVHSEVWNIAQGPFVYLPPPEHRPSIVIGDALVVNLNTTPADSITMSGTAYFSEIGS
jgi:hypothetical protein